MNTRISLRTSFDALKIYFSGVPRTCLSASDIWSEFRRKREKIYFKRTDILRKSASLAIIASILMPPAMPAFATGTVDFNVKITTAGDETYATSLGNVSYHNTDITFQFVEVSGGGASEYSISMPVGLTYQNSNTTGNTCANFSTINASDSNYRFSFNGSAGCLAKTEFTYRVTSSTDPGNANITLLGRNGSSWSIVSDIVLGISSANSITKAVTADLNANGYVDAYILSFATLVGVSAGALSGISIAGVTTGAASTSGSNWIVPFSDNILLSGITPEIGGTFDGNNLTNPLVNEEDGAAPYIMSIAGTPATATGISIGTGALTMDISEPLIPTATGSFTLKLGTGTIAGTYTLTGNLSTLVFVPNSPLVPGTYTLSNTTGATDWSAGANILSQTFPALIVPDTTAPGTGNITINAGAATTTSQAVTVTLAASDNVGVTGMMLSNIPTFSGAVWENFTTTKTWSLASSSIGTYTVYTRFRDAALNVSVDYSDNITIVAPPPSWGGGGWWGWGGGGGPSPDNCPLGDFSGNQYDNICTAPVTNIGTTNTWSTNTGTITPVAPWIPSISDPATDISGGTIDRKYFTSLAEARSYLLGRITHKGIVKLINSYGDRLALPDEAYFMTVDASLYPEYNRIINAYAILFLRVQDAVSGNRSATVKSEGRLSASIVTSGITLAKNFLDRYIIREYISEKNITLYRTKNPLLTKPLWVLEKKILGKFDTLLETSTISRTEYEISMQAYNDFVLHLIMYRDYGKNSLSKERAITAMKIFLATYKKKVGENYEPTLSNDLLKKQQEYTGN